MTDLPIRCVRVCAHAKINLSLRILGLRPDGYHEVRTVLQSLALHDTLTCTAARGVFRVSSDNPECPADESNLVWQAAEALWRTLRRRGALSGAHVHIRKRIPMRAGLGGGSSDAAAALTALAVLWDAPVPRDRLHGIARELGVDVSYFLQGGTALGLARGDVLYQLVDRPRAWVVLVQPAFGVSTPTAYRWWDETRAAQTSPGPSQDEVVNDLQGPVAAHHAEISRLVNRLRRLGALGAAMSGSGSAVFGLFRQERQAEMAARALAHRGRTVIVTSTIDRRQFSARSRPH